MGIKTVVIGCVKSIVNSILSTTVECMSSGTYTEPLNYATNFNVPLLIHIVVCSSGLNN
jgi:hypothetical protein